MICEISGKGMIKYLAVSTKGLDYENFKYVLRRKIKDYYILKIFSKIINY